MPAQAGICVYASKTEIPACAGMTDFGEWMLIDRPMLQSINELWLMLVSVSPKKVKLNLLGFRDCRLSRF
jgi:hypothetical protein